MKREIGDLHIDDFCKDTAKILIALYKSFPTKTTLYVEDIAGPDQPDEFGLHSPRFEACFSTLLWLKESDYLNFASTVRQEAVEDAVLSHRGFCFLSSFSELALDQNQHESSAKRVDQLYDSIKTGNSEHIKALVLKFMIGSRNYK